MELYIGLAVGFVVCIGLMIFCIYKAKQTKQNLEQIKNDLPIIQDSEQKVKDQLKQYGFVASYTASSFGYRFFEYQTKHNAPDNLNFLIDKEHDYIACYMLLPYYFKIYQFKDLLKYELMINNGQVETSSSTIATGTSIGGVGIGLGSTSGTAKQRVNAIMVQMYFDDGEMFGINFLNNRFCYQGDERYSSALTDAQMMTAQLDKIIDKNKKSK